jgi:hypothetical protein
MSEREEPLRRLDAVESRLAALAAAAPSKEALTDPDPGTGERWEAGQVWAHLAEFIPYWIEQMRNVIARYDGEPVPFGRSSTDPGRLGAIERDRGQPIAVLWSDTRSNIEILRRFLEQLDNAAWQARGLHPRRGIMSFDRIIDEFTVGHLEQHAQQLDELARA